MEVLPIVERVGAYAGFAAVIGLAVLSALYFSQARDLRRLREWAARAPERLSRPDAGRGAARPVPRQGAVPLERPAAAAGPGRPAATAPGAAAGGSAVTAAGRAAGGPAVTAAGRAAGGPAAPPAPAGEASASPGPRASIASAAPAATGGAAGDGTMTPPRPGDGGSPSSPEVTRPGYARPAASPPAGATPPRGRAPAASPAPIAPKRRGLAPRYMVLIVAGVLVLGGGIAFGVVQYTSTAPGPAPVAPPPPGQSVAPSTITVSVLNGTTVPGLAAQIGDKVESAGFRLGNVTNAGDQQRAESVVLYVPGSGRQARTVGRALDIEQTERAENGERGLAGPARVIVVVGADMIEE